MIPLASGGPSSSCVSAGGGAGVLLVHGGGALGGPGIRVDGTTMSSLSSAKSCSGASCGVMRIARSVHMSINGCTVILKGAVGGSGVSRAPSLCH